MTAELSGSSATGAAIRDTVLDVSGLRVTFTQSGKTTVGVDDVSFSVARGLTLGIVGESGSGKSVTARAIMNILPPTGSVAESSRVLVGGREVGRLRPNQVKHFWGVEAAMVFQDPMTSLTPVLRVGKQIMEPLRYHLRLGAAEAHDHAVELLTSVGIADPERRMRDFPHSLSGGMRQRVMIAIALSCKPKLLICDEPTTALDVTVQQQVLNILDDARIQRQMGMVLISHDLGVVATRADNIAVMYGAEIVEEGTASDVLHSPTHPYTRALLAALPDRANPPHTRLASVPGTPPVITPGSVGCRFAPRCPLAQAVCRERRPSLELVAERPGQGAPAHRAACFFPQSGPVERSEIVSNYPGDTPVAASEDTSWDR